MWQKNFYTGEELERMKSDAEKRVREMRERTQKLSGDGKLNQHNEPKTVIKEEGRIRGAREMSNSATQGLQRLIKSLAIDEEKLVVILLILVLIREKADSKLILALVWILI